MNLAEKKQLFMWGLQIFVQRVCLGDGNRYTDIMSSNGGYRECCKQFYLKSGRLTAKDRVVPDWMKDCFMRVEQQFFGAPLFTN